MSYLEEIKNDRLKEVTKRQLDLIDSTYKYWFLGEYNDDPEMFFESIYRTYLEQEKRRTFLVGKNFDKQFKCETVAKVIEKQKHFRFYTPSVFWHHKHRTKDELIWITEITLDFDFKKDGTDREIAPQQLAYILHKEFGYLPNAIWATRTDGNLQAKYLIEAMTGTPKSIYYYESIAKRMAILTGADVTAVSAVNLYTIPKHGFWKFSDKVHDIDDFSWVLEDEEIEKELERKRKEKVISFTEQQIMRHESIQMLLNAEFPHYRNNAAFTIALLYFALDKPAKEAEEFLKDEWFKKVNDGRIYSKKGKFLLKEVKSTVESAYSGKYHGPSREWIYLITGIEFPYNLYKSSYIKKGVYQTADEVQKKIIDWVRKNDGQTIKQPVLAEELDVPLRSFEKQIAELKKEGVINWTTERGRYSKGSTFHYTFEQEEKPFTIEADTSFNLSNVIDYFEAKEA